MAYIIDLQKLWHDRSQLNENADQITKSVALDPRSRLVSVVVIANGDENQLLHTLQSVFDQVFILEVIVVNREGFPEIDSIIEEFANHSPRCSSVTVKRNIGLAEAYNVGAQYASGQYLLLLEGSCRLPNNAVLKLISTGIRKTAPWVIGTAEGADDSPLKVLSRLTNFYSQDLHFQQKLPEVSAVGGGIHVPCIGGECIFIPSRTFMELRGLDKKCFDVNFHRDLCLRVHLAGGDVYQLVNVKIREKIPHPPSRLSQIFHHEWRSFLAWCHFYRKYVDKRSNRFSVGIFYGFFALSSLGKSLLRGFSFLLKKLTKSSVGSADERRFT
ncbi:MAG: glycosyltransferase [Candidatus Berkiellales bacterium]